MINVYINRVGTQVECVTTETLFENWERHRRFGIMSASYLVQILVPKVTGQGEPVSQEWFEVFLKELTEEFGVVTSFLRAPGMGLWRDGNETERDTIAVVEIMTGELAQEYWSSA